MLEAATAEPTVVVPAPVAVKPAPVVEAKAQVTPSAPTIPVAASKEGSQEAKPAGPAKSDKPMGARYADLARREKGLALSRAELKTQQDNLATAKAEIAAHKQALGAAKKNPAQLLQSLYGDKWYEALTELKLNGSPPADMALAAVEERISAFEAQQKAATEQQAKANQANQAAQLRAKFEGGAKQYIEANVESYELITLEDSYALVPQLIEAEYEKTGQMMGYKDAADRVEEYLTVKAKKLTAAKKLQPPAPAVKTLTNSMNGSAIGSTPAAALEGDPFARALAIFRAHQNKR